MEKIIKQNVSDDGIDRRGFLTCMAWAGTGLLWTLSGGILRSRVLGQAAKSIEGKAPADPGDFSFVQISDSHIGFDKAANTDVIGTLRTAIERMNAERPSFILHTGDLSHLSKASEFDTLDQVLMSAQAKDIFFVPGEHDVIGDSGKQYLDRYGKNTKGSGWYSFDQHGVHFIGLVNVVNLKPGGLGILGKDQLEWLEDDVRHLSASTPIVVFAHIPLWSVYPAWGWGTDDSAQALSYLKRFGSVAVLNGHIHQTMQKIEGNITFHTAMSTAFPQPAPGSAPAPGPMKVPAERLRSVLGLTSVNYIEHGHQLAVVDSPLTAASEDRSDIPDTSVTIDNFAFSPQEVRVAVGTRVIWTNRDDSPHTVTSTDKVFSSPALDTGESFAFRFSQAGEFGYFCSLHPRMTGRIVAVRQ